MRRPRVLGSTPQISTSWRSSPPIPTPNVSRPGASSAMVASWRATGHRVAQRQQVQRDVHRQLALQRQQRRRRDQPVGPGADEEAHVIAAAEVIDALADGASERRGQ